MTRKGEKIASAERTVCHRGHCGFGELETAMYVLATAVYKYDKKSYCGERNVPQ
mgnify:CR=1 FL=1